MACAIEDQRTLAGYCCRFDLMIDDLHVANLKFVAWVVDPDLMRQLPIAEGFSVVDAI
ncbi:hypothetical protein D3C81_1945650 [compost metagenome]